ncbi:hypothetical protein SAMN05443245_5242 [Paraburkholderia fungorum]|uniref:DUF4043 domain-containing protein n=1 Tax=Paraburkholderia fungorum TaxID=134537 RepID=A0A1H1IIT2_9BURK|nr:hypothetical protein [Paraburkholderia fungorum]SDR37592.1 hypothetical protein SAMN05443245_5242 [Paraburkholderia fungorum]
MPLNNLPTALQSAIQTGFLEHQFKLPLKAKLGFRDIADREAFTANIGETITKTRTGLLPAVTTAMSPAANSDITSGLTPQNYSIEQYILSIAQYAANMQLNVVTQRVAIADFFLRNAYALGEQAFRSVDTLAQQALYNTYLGGNTRVRTTLGSAGTTISVDDIRGFQTTFNSAGQMVTVSGSNPVNVTVGGDVYSLTGFAADGSNVSTTPGGVSGTLTFSTSVTVADGTAAQPVVSAVAPYVLRPSTTSANVMAATTAAISSANDINNGKLTMNMILNAKATMSANGVPVSNSSGMYNLYIDPIQATGLYSDPAFQQFFRGQVTTEEYRRGIIAEMLGVRLQETNLNPVQTLAGVGTVRRALLCGQGALVEGEFTADAYNAAMESDDGDMIAVVEGIAHVTREPLDALKQVVTQTWSYIGGFVVPSDITTTAATIPTASSSAFKRGIMLESL